MKKLLKHLKGFKDGDIKIICMELENFENNLHVDNHKTFVTNDENYLQSTSSEESLTEEHHYRKRIQSINSGLCIIINQMYFTKEVLLFVLISNEIYFIFLSFQYEPRFGTKADCIGLSETFKAFGFRIEILQNLKKNEMLEKIKNISKNYGTKYDCLFLCILSHGYKGE